MVSVSNGQASCNNLLPVSNLCSLRLLKVPQVSTQVFARFEKWGSKMSYMACSNEQLITQHEKWNNFLQWVTGHSPLSGPMFLLAGSITSQQRVVREMLNVNQTFPTCKGMVLSTVIYPCMPVIIINNNHSHVNKLCLHSKYILCAQQY